MPMETGPKNAVRFLKWARQHLALIGFAAVAVTVAVVAPLIAGRSSDGPVPVDDARLSQNGKLLTLEVRTGEPVDLRGLTPRAEAGTEEERGRLCLELESSRRSQLTTVCLGGTLRPRTALGLSRTTGQGQPKAAGTIEATVKEAGARTLVASFDPRDAGLPPGPYSWRLTGAGEGCVEEKDAGRTGVRCLTGHPGQASYVLRPVRAVGCTRDERQFVRHGPRGRRQVALTFDDGPGEYTAPILRILRRSGARATFFVLGTRVDQEPELTRQILDHGHELANHSYRHDLLPDGDDIRHATRVIRRLAGFRPCLFRPPYGAVDRPLMRAAGRAGMTVVNWDVDTNDWAQPGSRSIRRAIVRGVRPGSIVLMHDGGGPRGDTVRALPKTIEILKRRGFELVTVTELLGNRVIYRPVP